jgi:chorismate mutase
MPDLSKLRKEIDTIDDELTKLISKRFKVTKKVGKLKSQTKESVHQEDRWNQILTGSSLKADKLNIDKQMLIDIWDIIHKYSKSQQQEITNEVKQKK